LFLGSAGAPATTISDNDEEVENQNKDAAPTAMNIDVRS
jgi:hypothetical protein